MSASPDRSEDRRATGVVLVTVSVPDAVLGAELAEVLVGERLAACVKVLGPCRSTYRWKGVVEQAEEWRVEVVSTAAAVPGVVAAVRARHPDEVPEVVAVPVVDGDAAYLRWAREQVEPGGV